eukprot:TRINITY_DN7355_c0_g1_i2.p1 TRINITY_DN7355_c0_g1~~TRINITY_DN7355_c0_g1_i2.p1  ORF type:complete len:513 (+),score=79.52 TRINITY_DN7355_c0_g1_i2:61-1539(+)
MEIQIPSSEEQVEEEEEEEEEFSIFDTIYENEFPSSPLSDPESEQLDGPDHTDGSISAADDSFASDFYRSGTDWSFLKQKPQDAKLKQADLFQMWGFKKPQETNSRVLLPLPEKKRKIEGLMGGGSGGRARGDSMELRVSHLGRKTSARQRGCPFYKKIPGTPFTVDAFRYGSIEGCAAYFLSHFHCDHYGGLSKGWSHGPIYCTPLTGRLVKMCLSVNPIYICPLELDTEYVIEGIKVTMLEANHCPGAAMIHFRLADGQCYLHTGDFRACKLMQAYPILLNLHVNLLYLDTTYCNPRYKFPSKEDVVEFVLAVTKRSLAKQPKTLIVVGAYSIGKEHVYLAISEALGVQLYANASRRRILQSFDWPQVSRRLCSDAYSTPLHILPMSSLRPESLKQYLKTHGLHFTSVLAFRPTGWTYSESVGNQLNLIRPNIKGNVTIYGVPYSEHSSYLELREFVQFLKPDKIIPTVGVGNSTNRHKMQSHFKEWLKG